MQSFRQRLVYGLVAVVILGLLTAAWVWTRVLNPLPDAADLLQSAVSAGDRVTYEADVRSSTFYRGQTSRVTTKIKHTPTAEWMHYLDGPMPGLLVISQDDETYTIRPAGAAVVSQTPRQGQPASMDLLLKNHSAVVSGISKVAGRRCYVVEVMPKDVQGPSKRLYIDKRSHVILRTDERSSDGKLKASTEMTAINYSVSFKDDVFRLPSNVTFSRVTTSDSLTPVELSRRLGFDVKSPRYMTAGYVPDTQRLHKCSCPCGHESAQTSYTNGLSAVSIFQTSRLAHCGSQMCDLRPNKPDKDGCMISDTGRGTTVIVERAGKAVVVVGDLQCSELKKIAKSVQ